MYVVLFLYNIQCTSISMKICSLQYSVASTMISAQCYIVWYNIVEMIFFLYQSPIIPGTAPSSVADGYPSPSSTIKKTGTRKYSTLFTVHYVVSAF